MCCGGHNKFSRSDLRKSTRGTTAKLIKIHVAQSRINRDTCARVHARKTTTLTTPTTTPTTTSTLHDARTLDTDVGQRIKGTETQNINTHVARVADTAQSQRTQSEPSQQEHSPHSHPTDARFPRCTMFHVCAHLVPMLPMFVCSMVAYVNKPEKNRIFHSHEQRSHTNTTNVDYYYESAWPEGFAGRWCRFSCLSASCSSRVHAHQCL